MSTMYQDQSNIALSWWRALQPREFGGRMLSGDRAALARLKRASSVADVMAEPATADLFLRLGFNHHDAEREWPRAAVIAAVLAHVRKLGHKKIAHDIGALRCGDGSMALITPLRLKRLLAARTPDEVLTQFRRVTAILGHSADVRDLAMQLLAWTDGERGDLTRTRFAFDYHGVGQFASDA